MILLDTHVLLWLYLEPHRLSPAAVQAVRRARSSGGIAIASITFWEIAQLIWRRRLDAEGAVEAWISELVARTGVIVAELTPAVAALSYQFEDEFPGDPADRVIAATARAAGLRLVTKDRAIRASRLVRTVW